MFHVKLSDDLIINEVVWKHFSMITTYKTITSPTQAEFKDKGSRFIAFVYPIRTLADVKKYLDPLKEEHHKARHWCYAYRLGVDGMQFRANDDDI